ncbi:carbohydrate ABC transporter permease [Streptomyces sp. KR80]|uniref:carbohydrate ABC transporter permease n=1 Tax=Streptomyces sp. KR80 TaxID=3457426 RepID=UPI003FD3EEA5
MTTAEAQAAAPKTDAARSSADRPREPRKAGRRPRRTPLPYALIAPAVVGLGAVLGWPMIHMIILSFQDMRRNNLWGNLPAAWVGLEQYTRILGDSHFWVVAARSALFVVVCVLLSIGLGLLMAMLMQRISTWVRLLIIAALVAAWSIPRLVATSIFRWLFDSDYGFANSLLSAAGLDYRGHNWFVNPWSGFGVIVLVVVWGALPFIAITLYAALTQVPQELEEAARMDGAQGFGIFRHVTLPVIKPVLTMVTTLSVIWDFAVFEQVWLMRGAHVEAEYELLGLYAFNAAFTGNSFSQGAAIALITMLLLLGISLFYLRQMLKIGEDE